MTETEHQMREADLDAAIILEANAAASPSEEYRRDLLEVAKYLRSRRAQGMARDSPAQVKHKGSV